MADRHAEGIEKAAEAVWESIQDKGIRGRLFREDCDYVTDAAVAAYLEHAHPEVTTPEQLEALPVGTIIVNGNGNAWERSGRNWYLAGATGGQKRVPYLPARVIHWPDHA